MKTISDANEPKIAPLKLDTRLELTHSEIVAIMKENGGAVISTRQMRALAALGYQLETFGAVRTVQGESMIGRAALRGFLMRLHDLLETADLPQMIAAAPAVAAVHKQFNESLRVSREVIDSQNVIDHPTGPSLPPGQVFSFPTGPIRADTVIINESKPAKPSQ